jgi:hypothetical protein
MPIKIPAVSVSTLEVTLFCSLDLRSTSSEEDSGDSEVDGVGELEGLLETVGAGLGDVVVGPGALGAVFVAELPGRSETTKDPIWSKCV